MRREANKVADHLANKGIDAKADRIHWQANSSAETELYQQCRDLASRDFQAPYRVTAGERGPPGCDISRGLNEAIPPLNARITDAGLS